MQAGPAPGAAGIAATGVGFALLKWRQARIYGAISSAAGWSFMGAASAMLSAHLVAALNYLVSDGFGLSAIIAVAAGLVASIDYSRNARKQVLDDAKPQESTKSTA